MATVTTEAPQGLEPDIYDDVPIAEYLAWPVCSQTLLKKLDQQSPTHARWAMTHPEPTTPAKIEGAAIHTAALEPDLFDDRYVVSPPCSETTKKGAPCSRNGSIYRDGDWFCTQHDPWKGAESEWSGPTVLTSEVYDRVMRVRDALHAHPAFADLHGRATGTEQTVVFRDPRSDVLCKCRFDLTVAGVALADVKSTQDASEDAFRRQLANLGYAFQGALYLRAAEIAGIDAPHFVIFAAEKPGPNGVRAYRIHEGSIHAESERLDRALATWAECEQSGKWPGYPTGIEDVSLPEWAFKKLDIMNELEGL